MALVYQAGNYNVALNGQYDKMGDAVMKLKAALVATGRWRVMGSGSGGGGLFQLRVQTAGLGGSAPYDVLTGAVAGTAAGWTVGATTSSISNLRAWLVMEELNGSGTPTGRAFRLKRYHNDSSPGVGGAWSVEFTTGGYATTGANATTPPAPLIAGQTFQLIGTSFNDLGTGNWIVQDSSFGGDNVSYQSMTPTSSDSNWLHIATESAPGSDNVSGFMLTTYSRTQGKPGLCFYYRPLQLAAANDPHPFVVAAGNWASCFGQVNSGSFGPFYGSTLVRYGQTLAACSYERGNAANFGSAGNVPGTVFAPARSDNTVVTSPVEVWTASGQMGLLKDAYVNPHNRSYPTTYGVVSSTPRCTFGQIITEWVTNVSPNSSP